MTGSNKPGVENFAEFPGNVVSIGIMAVQYIWRIILGFSEPDSLVYKFVKIIPQLFFFAILQSATLNPDNARFIIDYFDLFIVIEREITDASQPDLKSLFFESSL